MISKYPTHKRAKEINRVYSNITDQIDGDFFEFYASNFEYSMDLNLGRKFWTPSSMNSKMFWSELKDPEKAVSFYNGLIKKYDDPKRNLGFITIFSCLSQELITIIMVMVI